MSKDFRSENCSASAPFSQEPSLFYEAELQVVLNIDEKQTNVSGCVSNRTKLQTIFFEKRLKYLLTNFDPDFLRWHKQFRDQRQRTRHCTISGLFHDRTVHLFPDLAKSSNS